MEYYFWNNGLGIGGFVAFPLLVDWPKELFMDPRELVAENGLEKQMENNTKCSKFLGEMYLEKEMDIIPSKGILARDECLEEQIKSLEFPKEKSLEKQLEKNLLEVELLSEECLAKQTNPRVSQSNECECEFTIFPS